MARITMRDLSGLNADRTIPFVNLSVSYCGSKTVKLDQRTIRELRMGHESAISVRKLVSRQVVVRGFDALKIPASDKPGMTIGGIHFDDLINLVCSKFAPILPGLNTSQLRSGLKEGEKGHYSYFGKVMDILQVQIANQYKYEEPWIKINTGKTPMQKVEEEDVIEYLRNRRSLFPIALYSVPTITFGFSTLLMFLLPVKNFAPEFLKVRWYWSAIALGCAIGLGSKVIDRLKCSKYLKGIGAPLDGSSSSPI